MIFVLAGLLEKREVLDQQIRSLWEYLTRES
jgi:hypothetical protein